MDKTNEKSLFGKCLMAYREQRGMTRQQLAKSCHLSGAFVAALESEPGKSPSVSTLKKIVDGLKLDSNERHSLLDAAIGIAEASTVIPYDADNVTPLLQSIAETNSKVTAEELSWLVEMQAHFANVLASGTITALLEERCKK